MSLSLSVVLFTLGLPLGAYTLFVFWLFHEENPPFTTRFIVYPTLLSGALVTTALWSGALVFSGMLPV